MGQLISSGFFDPHDVQYTIISESGASIYSISPEAKQEFPLLDPTVISAGICLLLLPYFVNILQISFSSLVSLGRRLQDPLTEFVRVSPEHIGVGMYQHDIPLKMLESALKDVVSECVSFVGVDLNTCPPHVLW